MLILIARRGDTTTRAAIEATLRGVPSVRVIEERRKHPLARPSVADRRKRPAMREQERRQMNRDRRATLGGAPRFEGVIA